jgi:hypothetical protein
MYVCLCVSCTISTSAKLLTHAHTHIHAGSIAHWHTLSLTHMMYHIHVGQAVDAAVGDERNGGMLAHQCVSVKRDLV